MSEQLGTEQRGIGKAAKDGHTPVMRQYLRAKQQFPGTVMLFRMGDFYEVFFEDAVLCAEALGITLTSRGKGPEGERIPMAGVPHHAASGYIAELIGKGHRVAVCEQMADPQTVKGVVPREVVRVVTPALCLDPDVLDARENSFLVAVEQDASGGFGFVALDITTGELRAAEAPNLAALLGDLSRLSPREVLVGERAGEAVDTLRAVLPRAVCRVGALRDVPSAGAEPDDALLSRVLSASGAEDLGVLGESAALKDASVLAFRYAEAAQPGRPLVLDRVVADRSTASLALDATAVQNLELVTTMRGEKKGTLLDTVDLTRTAMGGRALRMRLLAPSTEVRTIARWHDAVTAAAEAPELRSDLRRSLGEVPDLERLVARAVQGVATPRDLAGIRAALVAAAEASARLQRHDAALPEALRTAFPEDLVADVREALVDRLAEAPPLSTSGGGVVREGAFPEVDELRALARDGKDHILAFEARERDRTGIASLKVKYTRVFGYYIEITKANLGAVPQEYRRKQTIANGERFFTEELERLEGRILGAEEQANALEQEHFHRLRELVCGRRVALHRVASAIAELDVHLALAELAQRRGWVRPEVDDGFVLDITEGRHPVVEATLPSGSFVPNDVRLDARGDRLWLITGPNMAGKSTVLRQTALIAILAQAGSFVPAKRARVGVVDRVHTRVGASDNLARGQSTFMVEMVETAAILRAATERSLVLLDEVGRGTSTYDGLAIARAVAEHMVGVVKARTMFATHYHELCALEVERPGVRNFNTVARSHEGGMVFLHRLVPGGASQSYGIEVAKLAGLPGAVLARARQVLSTLERPAGGGDAPPRQTELPLERAGTEGTAPEPLSAGEREVLDALAGLDPDRMTPLEALTALDGLKRKLRGPRSS